MGLSEKIENLAKEALSSESHFLVNVVVSLKQGAGKVTIVIDGDNGITIDDCAVFSRKLGKLLEDQGEDVTLEVTTPGVDQPLKLKRQFTRNIGRSLKVQRKDKSVDTGKLVVVNDESIDLEREEKEGKSKTVKHVAIPFSEIERAIVQVSFK
jgi:ribosome maturation factor RimP